MHPGYGALHPWYVASHLEMAMEAKEPGSIPTMSALLAFESAARHGNFSRAARELGISQSYVSRQVAGLEKQLAVRLFERSSGGVALTIAGRRFRNSVKTGLGVIREATDEARILPDDERVVIACSDDVSHLYLLPRHDELRETLGQGITVRVLTYHHHIRQLPLYPLADVVLTWESSIETVEYTVLHEGEMGPVCSPQFASRHRETLDRPIRQWGGLPFLSLGKPNLGWTSLDDWFERHDGPESARIRRYFDSYTYVLEAASHGQGIALGCLPYLRRYLATGSLLLLADEFVPTGNRFCGELTSRGRDNPLARQCLEILAEMA